MLVTLKRSKIYVRFLFVIAFSTSTSSNYEQKMLRRLLHDKEHKVYIFFPSFPSLMAP
jgi:hypothetical protein